MSIEIVSMFLCAQELCSCETSGHSPPEHGNEDLACIMNGILHIRDMAKFEYTFEKCLFCLKDDPDSWEHIIPESIGGQFQAKILCKRCNSTLGSQLISKVKTDPSIRFAVRQLRGKLPDIHERIEKHQSYEAPVKDQEPIKHVLGRRDRIKVIVSKRKDGSIVFDKKGNLKHIEAILQKQVADENVVKQMLQTVSDMRPNRLLHLTPGVTVSNVGTDVLFQDFSEGEFLNDRVMTLMAFEYLSLLLGDMAYMPELDHVRDFVVDGKITPLVSTERFTARHYKTWHKVYIKPKDDMVTVVVMLFHYIVFKVSFLGFVLGPSLASNDHVLVEDIENSQSLIAINSKEAELGNYYVM